MFDLAPIFQSFDIIAQFVINLLGVGAIYLVTNSDKQESKYVGNLLGILAQPFWYFTIIYHSQWGLLIVNTVYCWIWISGFRKIKKQMGV